MEEFEVKVREIFHFIAEYGIKNKPLDFRNKESITKEDLLEFKLQVHKGFRIGQDMLLEEILILYDERKEILTKEKQAKKVHNKEEKNRLQLLLKKVDYKILVLRHFADFIAWQVFQGHHYKARRFFSGDRNRPDLLNTNLESVVAIVKQLHSENEYNFALISDLTTFIDIGDILLVEKSGINVIECKEGHTQSDVHKFLEDIQHDDWRDAIKKLVEQDTSNGKAKTGRFLDQAMRTVKQWDKGIKLREFIKNESGPDPFSEKNIEIIEVHKPDEYYYKELINAIDKAKKEGSTYEIINNIIYYAVFTGDKIRYSSGIFKFMSDKIPNKIAVDYISMIKVPIRHPLFFKPLGKETFFDLLFGRLKIYLAIDIDALLSFLNENGVKAEWMTTKETHRSKERGGKMFVYKNRAIKVYTGDKNVILGDAFIVKLLYDNLTPASLAEHYKESYRAKNR